MNGAPPFARRRVLTLVGMSAVASACVSVPKVNPAALRAGAFVNDPAHTSLIFRVAHLNGLSRFTARFTEIAASLDFDPEAPERSFLDVRIAAASIDTGLADFDRQLAEKADVLNGGAFPEIGFQSTGARTFSAREGVVDGLLTLRGQTRPVALEVAYNGALRSPFSGEDLIGFTARTRFDRTDFGADAWSNFGVGRDIEVEIDIEFKRASASNEP